MAMIVRMFLLFFASFVANTHLELMPLQLANKTLKLHPLQLELDSEKKDGIIYIYTNLAPGATCKHGYSPITTSWQDCIAAAKSLGYTGDSVNFGSYKYPWGTSRPQGCFQSTGNNRFHFNEGAGGNFEGNDKILCKLIALTTSPTPSPTTSLTSPNYVFSASSCADVGAVQLTSAFECGVAGKKLGYKDKDGVTTAVANAFRPCGCSWHKFGNVEFWTGNCKPDGGQFACNYNGYSGCICKKKATSNPPQYFLAREGANSCPGGSRNVESADCSAVASILESKISGLTGNRSGVVGLDASTKVWGTNWGHVPPMCSVQTRGDYAIHWNSNSNGNNDGGYSVVCEAQYFLAPKGENSCPLGSRNVDQEDCSVVGKVLGGSKTAGLTGNRAGVVGSTSNTKVWGTKWGWVPPECSLQTGGDYAVHWNDNSNGANDGSYSVACEYAFYSNYFLAPKGKNSCPAGTRNVEQARCLTVAYEMAAAKIKLLTGNRSGVVGLDANTKVWGTNWGWVPPKCSVQTGGDYAIHWNSNSNGNNDGGYSVVCEAQYFLALPGENSCPYGSVNVEKADCSDIGSKLGKSKTASLTGNRLGVVGLDASTKVWGTNWGWVPPTCSLQTGGDYAIHWNSNSNAQNDGSYSLVCKYTISQ